MKCVDKCKRIFRFLMLLLEKFTISVSFQILFFNIRLQIRFMATPSVFCAFLRKTA